MCEYVCACGVCVCVYVCVCVCVWCASVFSEVVVAVGGTSSDQDSKVLFLYVEHDTDLIESANSETTLQCHVQNCLVPLSFIHLRAQ